MLTFYHAPMSRSGTMMWILEELGADYQIEEVTIHRRDGSGEPDLRNPHPHGQVPAIVHNGEVVWEQSAIAIYLSELFPESSLVRPPGHSERGPFISWLVWYAATVEPALVSHFDKVTETDPGKKRLYDKVCDLLTKQLADKPYLMGDGPTLPDFFLAGALFFVRSLLPESQALDDYDRRMNDRPIALRLRGQG